MGNNQPTIGIALSGAGNRSSFFVGFLEALEKHEIHLDCITAMSGGSLVAAAFACGVLPQFKHDVLGINKETIKKYIVKSSERGGLYSLDPLEEYLRELIHAARFEDTRPKMAFVAVDIETGQQVLLCMGDIARAARISCTLPGVFVPVGWGDRFLVDGGLLQQVPLEALQGFGPDITIAVNTRGTKHIFTNRQIAMKKMFNSVKKFLFIDDLEEWISSLVKDDEDEDFDFSKKPGLFTVLGKSLDVAVQANAEESSKPQAVADLTITLDTSKVNRTEYNEELIAKYYQIGIETAEQYIPQIQALVAEKKKVGQII